MPTKKYILYKHTSPSGKVYIGITCKNPASRWGANGSGYMRNPHFWSAIKKYGWENIKHEIVLYGLSKEGACQKEKEYISKYHSDDALYGYNMTSGGEVGFSYSADVKAKISAASKRQWAMMSEEKRDALARRIKKGEALRAESEKKEIRARAIRTRRERYTPEELAAQYKAAATRAAATRAAKGGATPEQCAAISARMKKYWEEYHLTHPKKEKERRTPKVKVKLSHEEVLAKMSEGMKKKWQEPEYKEKMRIASEARRGRHFALSEEIKAKMRKPKSEATKAKMRKPKSEETRRKMSEAKKRYFANMTQEQRREFSEKFKKKIA